MNYTFERAKSLYLGPYATSTLRDSIANVQDYRNWYRNCQSRYRQSFASGFNHFDLKSKAYSIEKILHCYRYDWYMENRKKYAFEQHFHGLKALKASDNVEYLQESEDRPSILKIIEAQAKFHFANQYFPFRQAQYSSGILQDIQESFQNKKTVNTGIFEHIHSAQNTEYTNMNPSKTSFNSLRVNLTCKSISQSSLEVNKGFIDSGMRIQSTGT